MSIPLVDLKAQYAAIKPEVDAAIQRVLEHTVFIQGKEVATFEGSFADYVQVREAVGVSSGTAALRLSLEACGVNRGDSVITVAHTFIATAEAISELGARPIFVDIDPVSYTIDPNQVEDAIKRERARGKAHSQVRAIVPVHLYGQPADMGAIMDIARRYELWVVEDAAQAHGAEFKGQRCGGIGNLGCFSFYPAKNLGAYGDAGAVTGNDPTLLARVRSLRDHGRLSKYEHREIGWGERLDALQAAILGAKLPHLEKWTEARRAHARTYNELLADSGLALPSENEATRDVYHLYVVRTKRRDELLAHFSSQGIGAGIHYPVPLHRQPAYLELGYGEVVLPVTERVASEVLSLPMYPELTHDQLTRVALATKEFFA